MENTVIEIVKDNAVSTVTQAPVIDSIIGVAAIVIPLCFKSIREFIVKKCNAFVASRKKQEHALQTSDFERYYNIDNTLAILQDNTCADRISIYQFHNGEEFSVHNPIFKFTCSHCFVSPGVHPDSDIVRRLVVSNYMDFVGPMVSDDFMRAGVERLITEPARIIKYNIKNMPYSATRYLFDGQGTDILFGLPLLSEKKGNIIGMICFHYLNAETQENFFNIPAEELYAKVSHIQHIINSNVR